MHWQTHRVKTPFMVKVLLPIVNVPLAPAAIVKALTVTLFVKVRPPVTVLLSVSVPIVPVLVGGNSPPVEFDAVDTP